MLALGCTIAAPAPAPTGANRSTAGSDSDVDGNAGPAAEPAQPSANRAGPASSGSLQRITLGVPVKSLNFLPLYVGHDEGLFAAEGLEVEIVVMPAEVGMAGLVSGSLDYSAAGTAALRAATNGVPVRALGFMSVQPTFYLMSKPNIRTLTDLRQKVIATSSLGSSGIEIARIAVQRAGLDPQEDIQILPTGATANAYTALVSGQVDAAVLSVPFNVQAEHDGFYPLLYAGDITSSPESGLATSVDRLQAEPDQVTRMLRVMLRSVAYVRDHKPEVTERIAREFSVSQDLADGAYETMLRSYSQNGEIVATAIEDIIRTQRAEQGIAQEITVGDVADFGPLRQAQRDLGLP